VISTLQKKNSLASWISKWLKNNKTYRKVPHPPSLYFETPSLTFVYNLNRFRCTFHQLHLPPSENHECAQSNKHAENEIKYQFEMQSPYRETNSRTAGQGILRVLCKPRTQHLVYHTCHCPLA